jgi:glucose-6-phosphate isomerase
LTAAFEDASRRLDEMACADALWSRRLSIWPQDSDSQASVANRLGWLSALDFIVPLLPRLRAFADTVRRDGFTDVVLLGMGGSSLAPEVLRQVLGVAPGFPRFRMLDSVDPDAVRAAFDRAESSLFVVASKSGSTIEPHAMSAEARRRVLAAGLEWGSRAVAITDEGSGLHQRAMAERYRDVFINPADIGGRYSALSCFGLVPAALMGAELDRLIARAREMETACRAPMTGENPGLALGAWMAAGAKSGRDKLTLVLPARLQSMGLWVEQLVAESTGKNGRGIVPIAGEPADAAGDDRLRVIVTLAGDDTAAASVSAGSLDTVLPALEIEMPDVLSIGAEFFRWEFATAAAGALMGLNPFDEPNVAEAKRATRELLDLHASQRRLQPPEPDAVVADARLTLSHAAAAQLDGQAATSFLSLLRKNDYFGLLAYVPPDDVSPEAAALGAALHEFRLAVGSRTGCATMAGYGPRYLHSTGQLHKGGANNGVFIVVTAGGVEDLAVPGESYTFRILELAQGIGDYKSLSHGGRRVLYLHLPTRDVVLFQRVTATLLAAAELDTK